MAHWHEYPGTRALKSLPTRCTTKSSPPEILPRGVNFLGNPPPRGVGTPRKMTPPPGNNPPRGGGRIS